LKRRMKVKVEGYKELSPDVVEAWGYVSSESIEGLMYHVRVTFKNLRPIKWSCECPDHVFRGYYRQCKHVSKFISVFVNQYRRRELRLGYRYSKSLFSLPEEAWRFKDW